MTSGGILIPVKNKSIKNIFIYWILLMIVFTGVLEFHSKYILILFNQTTPQGALLQENIHQVSYNQNCCYSN